MKISNPFDRRRFLASLLGSAFSVVTLPASAAARHRTILIQRSPLAGFQYYHGENLWQQLRQGDALTLVREPNNPHANRAVAVHRHGHKLGYLPRRENTAVAQILDSSKRLDARIVNLNEAPNPWDRIEFEVGLTV